MLEFYDQLIEIYSGSPFFSPLAAGIDAQSLEEDWITQDDIIILCRLINNNDYPFEYNDLTPETQACGGSTVLETSDVGPANESITLTINKRYRDAYVRLIANKRRHMERRKSASQRV